MGISFSKIWQKFFSKGTFKIIIIGLDNAGKTTTLYKLHLGEVVVTQPTIGSNVEQIVHKNITFECWDLGGQESLRASWTSYYLNTHAVVLVVDSTDRERIGIVREEFQKILGTDEHRDFRKTEGLTRSCYPSTQIRNPEPYPSQSSIAKLTPQLTAHSPPNSRP
mmetsp:Transcript_26548/g.41559  ORF Transcript_26548/g.41559 Transcript_26548/m.41559 type:complete len:165 (+) Transcript_26548:218-712(+)